MELQTNVNAPPVYGVVIGRCRDCKHWNDPATNAVYSHRMKYCDGLKSTTEPHPDLANGSWIYETDSAMPAPVECRDRTIEPRFVTGPDFGCVCYEAR